MSHLHIRSWNIKEIKYPMKKNLFWNKVKKGTTVQLWAIQEHHLDAGSPRKQAFGSSLVFYGEGGNGFSGFLSLVKREMEPRVVYNHPSRRVLGIQIKWDSHSVIVFNVYAPNLAKERAKIWRDLADLDIKGDW